MLTKFKIYREITRFVMIASDLRLLAKRVFELM